ncbi:hypothetical protein D9M72_286240 [compost metagenome]
MRIAQPARQIAGDHVVDGLVAVEGKDAVEQGHVDMLALPAALTPGQRSRNGQAGVHGSGNVRDGNANLLRAASGQVITFTGDTHQSAHALEHEVVPRPVPVGTGLAEAGHGAIDQARIHFAQIVIGKPVTCQRTDLVVFDQHV